LLLSISFHFFSRFQQLRQPLSTEIIRQAVISDDLKYLEAVSDENLVFVWRADANDSLFCLFFLFFFSSSFLLRARNQAWQPFTTVPQSPPRLHLTDAVPFPHLATTLTPPSVKVVGKVAVKPPEVKEA